MEYNWKEYVYSRVEGHSHLNKGKKGEQPCMIKGSGPRMDPMNKNMLIKKVWTRELLEGKKYAHLGGNLARNF